MLAMPISIGLSKQQDKNGTFLFQLKVKDLLFTLVDLDAYGNTFETDSSEPLLKDLVTIPI